MNFLVVVAHPDDEVLGAGATMHKLANEGNTVNVCIMSGEVEARDHRPAIDNLNEDVDNSLRLLGVKNVSRGKVSDKHLILSTPQKALYINASTAFGFIYF